MCLSFSFGGVYFLCFFLFNVLFYLRSDMEEKYATLSIAKHIGISELQWRLYTYSRMLTWKHFDSVQKKNKKKSNGRQEKEMFNQKSIKRDKNVASLSKFRQWNKEDRIKVAGLRKYFIHWRTFYLFPFSFLASLCYFLWKRWHLCYYQSVWRPYACS